MAMHAQPAIRIHTEGPDFPGPGPDSVPLSTRTVLHMRSRLGRLRPNQRLHRCQTVRSPTFPRRPFLEAAPATRRSLRVVEPMRNCGLRGSSREDAPGASRRVPQRLASRPVPPVQYARFRDVPSGRSPPPTGGGHPHSRSRLARSSAGSRRLLIVPEPPKGHRPRERVQEGNWEHDAVEPIRAENNPAGHSAQRDGDPRPHERQHDLRVRLLHAHSVARREPRRSALLGTASDPGFARLVEERRPISVPRDAQRQPVRLVSSRAGDPPDKANAGRAVGALAPKGVPPDGIPPPLDADRCPCEPVPRLDGRRRSNRRLVRG